MDVKHKDYQDSNFDANPFLLFERDFKCTLFCLDRPELKVHSTESGSPVYLGKVKNPFRCCELICEVFDSADLLKYYITGSLCQCGVLCEGPCCQKAILEIRTPDQQQCGTLKRVPTSVLQNCLTTKANFAITFPVQATPIERALFIAAGIMIDFSYFEKKSRGVASS